MNSHLVATVIVSVLLVVVLAVRPRLLLLPVVYGFAAWTWIKTILKIPAAVLELGENISLGETAVVESDVVGTYVHSNRKIGVLVGVSGGTKEQAVDAAMHAAAMSPMYVQASEVPADLLVKEREIWKEQMSKEKPKPAEIMEKIMLGKERKFRE